MYVGVGAEAVPPFAYAAPPFAYAAPPFAYTAPPLAAAGCVWLEGTLPVALSAAVATGLDDWHEGVTAIGTGVGVAAPLRLVGGAGDGFDIREPSRPGLKPLLRGGAAAADAVLSGGSSGAAATGCGDAIAGVAYELVVPCAAACPLAGHAAGLGCHSGAGTAAAYGCGGGAAA